MKKTVAFPNDLLDSIFKVMRIKNYESNYLEKMRIKSISTDDNDTYIYEMSDDYYHGWLDKYIPKTIIEKLRWMINTTEFDEQNRIMRFELKARDEKIIFICNGSLEFHENDECVLTCDNRIRVGYAGISVPFFISSFLLRTLPKRIIGSMEIELEAALNILRTT